MYPYIQQYTPRQARPPKKYFKHIIKAPAMNSNIMISFLLRDAPCINKHFISQLIFNGEHAKCHIHKI